LQKIKFNKEIEAVRVNELNNIKKISQWSIVGDNTTEYIFNNAGQKILRTQQNTIKNTQI